MKIVVMNFSGNVGKSTIARHLLMPRLKSPTLVPIESINSDDTDEDAIRGKQYGDLLEAMSLADDAIIDVGSSNVEEFMNRMRQYRGSHEDFDYYLVPAVSQAKQLKDTIATIEALAENGVQAKKIRVVFNYVKHDETLERGFDGLLRYHAAEKKFTLVPGAVIHENDIYDKIKSSPQGIVEILSDATDLKEMLKAAKSTEEKLAISHRISLKRLAAGVKEELDATFKVLFR